MNAAASIAVTRRVDWADTDAGGICYYAAFARLADAAESLLFDRLGLADAFRRLPRVSLSVDYHQPLLYNDVVVINYIVKALGRSSYVGRFEIVKSGGPAVTGTMTSALVDDAGQAQPWPTSWRALLLESGHLGREEINYV